MSVNNSQINKGNSVPVIYEILEKNIQNYDFSYKIIIAGNPGNLNILKKT